MTATVSQSPSRSAGTCLFAVVLAAGTASRYGGPKQLAEFRGSSLVARAVRNAEQVCGQRSVLVTGCNGQAVHAACSPLAGFLVHNENYRDGLGSSVACGVAAIADVADGVLLLLADQPLVTAADLDRLIAAWHADPGHAVASRYAGTGGVPAIFPASDFDALRGLTGERGAQALLRAHGRELRLVDCAHAATDIDRPADLEELTPRDQA